MKKALFALLFILGLVLFSSKFPRISYASTLFQDTFTDTDGTLLENHNAAWNNTGNTSVAITNNQVQFDPNVLSQYILNGFDNQQDQCVSVDYNYNYNKNDFYLYVRYGGGTASGGGEGGGTKVYQAYAVHDTVYINRNSTTLWSEPYPQANIRNLKFCAIGTTLSLYVNGNLEGQASDGYFTKGTAGFLSDYTNASIDNFTYTGTTNTPPSVTIPTPTPINEGDTYSSTGSFTDPDSTSWTGTVDYGDGGGAQSLSLNSDKTFSLSHVYKDEGTYTVTVAVTDNQGATGTGTATITVNNAPFSVGTITVPTPVVQVNTPISASASYTDPGVLDTHTATWDWGDGSTPTTGTVSESNGSGTVGADSHTYTAAGIYTVTLTVTDDDGVSNTSTYQYISVYAPTTSGKFSAGSHYTSPAGAYLQNTSLTGDVKFGLVYKYQGTMPVGDKQFSMDFKAANFQFDATSVSSLVIANGIGTLTGTGTINGSGTYNFLVTGSQSAGTIRIQIKDQSGNVIYDTQPGAPDTATPTTAVTGNVVAG